MTIDESESRGTETNPENNDIRSFLYWHGVACIADTYDMVEQVVQERDTARQNAENVRRKASKLERKLEDLQKTHDAYMKTTKRRIETLEKQNSNLSSRLNRGSGS